MDSDPPASHPTLPKQVLGQEHRLSRGLCIEELIGLDRLFQLPGVREQRVHINPAIGNEASTVGLARFAERPRAHDGQLLSDHVRADIDGHVVALADKGNTAPFTSRFDGLAASLRRSATIHRAIYTEPVGQVLERDHGIIGAWVYDGIGTKLGRPLQALWPDVYGYDAGAHGLGQLGGAEPDRSLAEHRDGFRATQAEPLQRTERRARSA